MTAELDLDIKSLEQGIQAWAGMPLHERADLMRELQGTVAAAGEEWALAAIAAKGTPAGPLESEEWLGGPGATAPMLAEYAATLDLLAAGKSAIDGYKIGTAPGGRTTVRVTPKDAKEGMLLNGFTADVWLTPGVSPDQARKEAGLGALKVGENGGVGLVLGAGNVTSIGPLDVVYELVAHNRASILKLNPTFETLLPAYEKALAPLISRDLLRIVNGGPEVGGYLANHDGIGHVHITGSGRTHDAIVWGPGEEGVANKAAGTPKLGKEMTSELGGVSPIIVVPGTWSKADIEFQAEHAVTQRMQNAGHNCIGGQALILSSDWAQKDEFLAAIRKILAELPARKPWYPNGQASIDRARATYADAEQVGSCLVVTMDASKSTELYDGEYFAAVLGVTELPGLGAEFFQNAVTFANDTLDGSLGGSVIVAPADIKAMGPRFDELVAEMKFGAVGINVWSAFAFLIGGAVWGAYPGQTLDDVGSGIGVVHNTHLLAHTEKTVGYGPFRPFPRSILGGEMSLAPRPPWFVRNRTADKTGKAMVAFAGKRTWGNLIKVLGPAVRG